MLLFFTRRTSNRQSFSPHVFSNMCSVIVAKVSVILSFKFVISGTGVENTLSLTYPHKKKSRGVISGDRGGQGVGSSLPIHLFGYFASKNWRACEPQCGGPPSCWKIILGWNSSNWGATYSFLLINVCNQGKNLCSPCISNENATTDNAPVYLTFIDPCIVNIISEYNQQDAKFHKLIYLPDAVCVVLCAWWWTEKQSATCRASYKNKHI